MEHAIDTEGHPPIKQYAQQIPHSLKQKVQELVDEMLGANGPSDACWIFRVPSDAFWIKECTINLSAFDADSACWIDHCIGYMDDILVLGDTFPKHLENLEIVLERLRKVNLKLKPSKCHLVRPSVSYLGYEVSAKGIATDPEAVQEFPVSRSYDRFPDSHPTTVDLSTTMPNSPVLT